MNLADPVNNVEVANFHVGSLLQMRSLNPQQNIDAILTAEFGQPITSRYQAGTPNSPAVYWGGTPSRKIIYLDGVTTLQQSQFLLDGYNNGSGPTTTDGFNPWFINAAIAVARTLTTTTLAQAEYVDVVGYSAGGAIAYHVVNQLAKQGFLYKTRAITFGAPRPGDTNFRLVLARTAIGRWFNTDDAIPLIPPRVTDIPLLLPAYGVLQALRWGSFVHPGGGIQLNQDGSVEPAVLPAMASVNVTSSLASWLFGTEGDPANPHGLAMYRTRLLIAMGQLSTPRQRNVAEGPPEVQADAKRAEQNARERQVAGQIQEAAREQNLTEPVVDDTRLFIPVRLGRVWAVSFGGQIIAYAPIEKRARHIARAGNDFLRSMPKQAIVDVESLVIQLQDFFNAAIQPGGPSNPPIRIGL